MDNLIEPFNFPVERNNYNRDDYLIATPYSSLDWKDSAVKYGIKLPNIIDMTYGISKCRECKAVYAGYQYKCNLIVDFHRPDRVWHDIRGYSDFHRNFKKECEGFLEWNLQREFDTQKEFFSLLEKIGYLPDLSYDPLIKFKDSFPQGVPEALKIRLMYNDIENLKMELPRIMSGIKMIVDKMNNAGACLSF